ncbi:MAG: glutamate 5-kinase [Eubacteriales bacterium]|nr:glutamate 5-kinase [Eubacteriales bacterium]
MKRNRCIVVKVGTSTLTHEDGKLNIRKIKQLVKELATLSDLGHHVILVSSGAVGAGIGKLGLPGKPAELVAKRALAAIGQVELIHLYESLFFAFDKTIAQLLLTKDDFSNRQRYLNARNMVHHLLDMGVIPVVNENDTVVVDEIKVGDNDSLSAFVAALVDADLAIIVSDIEGLYDKDPNLYPDAKLIPEVHTLDDEIRCCANGTTSCFGTGGMTTKIQAARMCMENGTDMVICNGADPHNIGRAAAGVPVGTLFYGNKQNINARKYWLKYATDVKGRIAVDKGAASALSEGHSLLPVGIIGVDGTFERGSVVEIVHEDKVLAVGIVNYSGKELDVIQGLHSGEIQERLGYKYEDVVIHSDNLVLNE